jgi:hypothetical protein
MIIGYIVLMVDFFKTKTNNKENHQRFLNSGYFNSFMQPKPESKHQKDMYIARILPKDISNNEMLTYLAGLLRDVYGKETRILVRVNIW